MFFGNRSGGVAGRAVDVFHRVQPVAVRLPLGEVEALARMAADGASSLVDSHSPRMNKERTNGKAVRLG